MKKVNSFRNTARTLNFLIPLALVLMISAISCAGSKKLKNLPPSPPPPPPPEEIFTIVEEMPQYPGGEEALLKFIMENVRYPSEAKARNIQGRVIVRFVINYQGSVENVEVVRGVDPLLDAEAVRVVSMLKGFTPGMQIGKPVKVWYSVPITFALKQQADNSADFILKGNDTIFLRPSEPPQYPGGREELFRFTENNFKIPGETSKAGFQGSLMVSFFVGRDGSLSDFAVLAGLSPSADAEALKVARMMPRWIPGKMNGKPVSSAAIAVFAPAVQPKMFQGEPAPDAVFVVVEEMPVFPRGEKALMDYIYSNLKYPEAAKANGIQGKVILRFCVTSNGGIDRVSVIRGVSPELDAEAVRVIKSLPAWQPGKQGGKAVNVWYSLPLTFTLTGQGEKPSEPAAVSPPLKAPQFSGRSVFEAGYDEPPLYPGGEAALAGFIESVKKYPQQAKTNNITGTAVVNFTIDETGKVVNPLIFSGVNPELDIEAIRVVNSLTGWQPAKRNGKPVKAGYRLAISFR